MQTSTRFEELSDDARYLEYRSAADPVGSGRVPAVPVARFGRWRYDAAATGVVPLDLAPQLGLWNGPATTPGLLASFVRIRAGEHIFASPNVTSQLYYVIEGDGFTAVDGRLVRWEAGDFLTLPSTQLAVHAADTDAALFWVHDEPMLRHLGVRPAQARFRPTKYPRARLLAELEGLLGQDGDPEQLHVLLANADQEQAATVTPVLRASFGMVPEGGTGPRRHPSAELVLVAEAAPGCCTLLGSRLDGENVLVDPIRVDWEPGGAFVTPPGMWHSHLNASGAPATIVRVEDAGLHAYLRSLHTEYVPHGDLPGA